MIDQRRRRTARRVEITQRRNHCVTRLRIAPHRAHDPGDRSGIIGIDQDIVLDTQQGTALQLAGQAAAIPEILVQPPRQQRQRIAVPQLLGGAKPFVERSANNAVMVDQRESFVGDDPFELISGRPGAGDTRRATNADSRCAAARFCGLPSTTPRCWAMGLVTMKRPPLCE